MNNDFLIINSFSKFIEIKGEEKVDFEQTIKLVKIWKNGQQWPEQKFFQNVNKTDFKMSAGEK